MLCIVSNALVVELVKVPTCLYSSITLNRSGNDLLGSLIDDISGSIIKGIEGEFTKRRA